MDQQGCHDKMSDPDETSVDRGRSLRMRRHILKKHSSLLHLLVAAHNYYILDMILGELELYLSLSSFYLKLKLKQTGVANGSSAVNNRTLG